MCVTPFKFLSFWERSSTPRTCSLSINQTYFQLYSCSSSPAELLSHCFVFLDFNSWHIMAGAKIHRETRVMWKKVQKALAAWVERLFGVWSTLFFEFLQMCVRIFELQVRVKIILKKIWCFFSKDDSSRFMKAVFLLGWWQLKIKAIIFLLMHIWSINYAFNMSYTKWVKG